MSISGAIHQFDTIVLWHLYGSGDRSALLWTMVAVTLMGEGWNILGLVPLLIWPRTRGFAVPLLVVLLAMAAIVFSLKRAVRRIRPCFSVPGVHALWGSPTDYSFPSGHTAGTFTFAGFVTAFFWLRLPRSRGGSIGSAFAFLFAAAVGISRIYLGVHFPSDVVGSAVLGTVSGIGGALALSNNNPPAADPPSSARRL